MSTNAGDAGAEIAEMKEILNRIQFDVEFKLIRGHEPAIDQFNRNPLQHLMKGCDEEARKIRENCITKERETNIKHVGKCSLEIRGKIVTNSVIEAIRIADAN